MAVTPARWLVDRSFLVRLDHDAVAHDAVAEIVLPRIRAGQVGVALVTELEVGFSVRSMGDDVSTRDDVLDDLLPVAAPARAEQRARELQALLVRRGQHRAVSIPDLILAAIADIEQLIVLDYNHDVDLVAEVTGERTEWVCPRGGVSVRRSWARRR